MGTRHMIAVVNDGRYRVAQYGQWDGYPSGQGVDILEFLLTGNVAALRTNSLKCSFISDEEYSELWKDFGIDIQQQAFVDGEIAKKFKEKYPQLYRDAGSDVLGMVAAADKGLKLLDDYTVAADSLFCEWAYVIDFDKDTFEVYEGFNTSPLDRSERFFGLSSRSNNPSEDSKYYPVKLKAAFSLSALPTKEDFLSRCEPPEDGDWKVEDDDNE